MPDTATLLDLSDLNYAEAMREFARRAGGTVVDDDGILLFAGAHRLPVLCNGVMRTDLRRNPADVIARAREFFAPRRRGYSVLVRGHADEALQRAAADAGLLEMGAPPGMVLERRLPDAPPPAGVTLARIETAADVAAFAEVMGAAYGTYGMPPDVTPALFARPETLIGPHIVSFLARLEGRPVAGAVVLLSHGVAGVYWVGTTPEARGRGLAELCTRVAGNTGFDLGARFAVLQASPMGAPVYRRMGWVEVTRYPYLVEFHQRAEEP